MTAVSGWQVVGPHDTDAELVRASLAGDRTAFGQMYDRYADSLHDFCIGMLHDRDGAADCVQDCFCVAATRLTQLRDPEKLRPWLYSIARNQALRRIRDRRRETPSEELPDTVAADAEPDTLAARTELADLIAEAAGGLSDRDRSLLNLAYHQGLDGPELAEALGVSLTNANTRLQRLKQTIERSLGALLVSRRAHENPDRCPELAVMLDNWDGHFNVLMRKRISRHIESCGNCDRQRLELVSPAALLGAAPVFIPAPAWLRDRTLGEIELTAHGSAMNDESDKQTLSYAQHSTTQDGGTGESPRRRRLVWLAALLIAVLGASLGLTYAWLQRDPVSVIPADVSGTAPEPDEQATIPANPPPAQTGVQVQPTDPIATVQAPTNTPPLEILIPGPPPVDDSPPPQDFEPTPELEPPVPPSLSQEPRETPTPTRTRIAVTPRAPASQSPTRGTINNPAPPDGDSPTRGSDSSGSDSSGRTR